MIKVDEKNKTVIGFKGYKGGFCKATATCKGSDVFDVDIGTKIVESKLNLKVLKAKRREHEKCIKQLSSFIKTCSKRILFEESIINSYDSKLNEANLEYQKIMKEIDG